MEASSFLTRQLPYLVPLLLVYLAGVVVALVYFRRCAGPATLVLISCVLLLLITITFPFIQSYLFDFRSNTGLDSPQFEWTLLIAGVARNLLYAAAFALLLVAAFMGRRTAAPEHIPEVLPVKRASERLGPTHGIAPTGSEQTENRSCYLCGRTLTANEMEKRVCRACRG